MASGLLSKKVWVGVGATVAAAVAFAGCGGGGEGTGSASSSVTKTTTSEAVSTTSAQAISAEDCAALGTVLSDIKTDTHPDWNFAFDLFPNDYVRDQAVLHGLSVPAEIAGEQLPRLQAFVDAYASAAQDAGVVTGTIPATLDLGSAVWQSVNSTGVDSIELRIAIRILKAWTANGCSGAIPSTVPTATVASPSTTTTETAPTTETTATGAAVNVGETATWNGDTFTVSDVKTSDTAPVADLFGEKRKAENGVWLSFKITPADDHSGIWGLDFPDNMQVKGGDGVVYDRTLSNQVEQAFKDANDFLVWVDIPEVAVSGAVLEVNDGLHTVDPDPSNPFVEPVPDPAYATRVSLGS